MSAFFHAPDLLTSAGQAKDKSGQKPAAGWLGRQSKFTFTIYIKKELEIWRLGVSWRCLAALNLYNKKNWGAQLKVFCSASGRQTWSSFSSQRFEQPGHVRSRSCHFPKNMFIPKGKLSFVYRNLSMPGIPETLSANRWSFAHTSKDMFAWLWGPCLQTFGGCLCNCAINQNCKKMVHYANFVSFDAGP